MKKILITLALAALSVTSFAQSKLQWDPNPPEDKVTIYVLEHRAIDTEEWTRVEVAGTDTSVVIPEAAFNRWFRIAAVNSFGQSEWTAPVKLPKAVEGIRVTITIEP
jgi:flavin-dependent dehydrogenase